MPQQSPMDRRYANARVGDETLARVREALKERARTADEVVEATGISRSQVGAALHHVGTVLTERRARGGKRGRDRQVWMLAPEGTP